MAKSIKKKTAKKPQTLRWIRTRSGSHYAEGLDVYFQIDENIDFDVGLPEYSVTVGSTDCTISRESEMYLRTDKNWEVLFRKNFSTPEDAKNACQSAHDRWVMKIYERVARWAGK